jgi:hypothetical protein
MFTSKYKTSHSFVQGISKYRNFDIWSRTPECSGKFNLASFSKIITNSNMSLTEYFAKDNVSHQTTTLPNTAHLSPRLPPRHSIRYSEIRAHVYSTEVHLQSFFSLYVQSRTSPPGTCLETFPHRKKKEYQKKKSQPKAQSWHTAPHSQHDPHKTSDTP